MRPPTLTDKQKRFIFHNRNRLTINEMVDLINHRDVTYHVVWNTLRRWGMSYKKDRVRWTQAERRIVRQCADIETAMELTGKSYASVRPMWYKLHNANKKGPKKPNSIQITNWLDMEELADVAESFDSKGIIYDIKKRGDKKCAIFRKI